MRFLPVRLVAIEHALLAVQQLWELGDVRDAIVKVAGSGAPGAAVYCYTPARPLDVFR
jgi:hypothetical protein